MQMAGGMLEAHKNNMLILVDGFISTVAFLIAFLKNPAIKQNAIFCHCSAEKAHKKLLEFLEVKPILNLDLRLGEGTGCAIAFPISALSIFMQISRKSSRSVDFASAPNVLKRVSFPLFHGAADFQDLPDGDPDKTKNVISRFLQATSFNSFH